MIRRFGSLGGSRWLLVVVAITMTAAVLSLTGLSSGGTDARPAERAATAPSGLVRNVVFAIHGGAGTIRRQDLTPEQERQYRDALRTALERGYTVIRSGGQATDAVEAAIVFLEDSPLFNAGKGAVFTTDAANELDASIMDGDTLDAGAVTGITHIKNPIRLARDLMENSRHVMMAGYGAELYAQHRGFDLVTQDYFFTDRRWQALLAAKGGKTDFNFGIETNTVGAVGLDVDGDLAGGTSTGGLTNKPVGRIGDSPIIGAGTYANNDTVAVSATGTGEFFIRQVVTHDISALMAYRNLRVDKAAEGGIQKVADLGGTGGVIALANNGDFAMPFNTNGMFRGYVTRDGRIVVKMFADE